jgi:hypothetical protein
VDFHPDDDFPVAGGPTDEHRGPRSGFHSSGPANICAG